MRFITILASIVIAFGLAPAPVPAEFCNKYFCNLTMGLSPIVAGISNTYHSVDNTTFSHYTGYTSLVPTEPNDYELVITLVIKNVAHDPCVPRKCWVWVHIYSDPQIVGYVSGHYEHVNNTLKFTYGTDFSTNTSIVSNVGPWNAVMQLCITNGGGGDCLTEGDRDHVWRDSFVLGQ